MSTRDTARRVGLALTLAAGGSLAAPPTPGLGRPISPAEAAAADPTVFPDGRGLPAGRGTVAEGRLVYDARCARCHGPDGSGGHSGRLVGREPWQDQPRPDKTVGQYWPFATTLFDYTRRAMPIDSPGSLSADEVYAVTAYLLHANGIIAAGDEMNPRSLPGVAMPNRDGFVRMDRAPDPAR